MKIETLSAENLLGFDSARFDFGGSGVVNFIGGRAARGKKGAEIEAALAKFREVGAVTETSFERISARKE